MVNDLTRSLLWNPMMLWADLGLRALDLSISLAQNSCDGADRLTRAAASDQTVLSWHAAGTGGSARSAEPEDPGLDLMTQGLVQWMSTLGTIASLGAGRGLDHPMMHQELLPDVVARIPLASASYTPVKHARSDSSLRKRSRQRQQFAERPREHAVATATSEWP